MSPELTTAERAVWFWETSQKTTTAETTLWGQDMETGKGAVLFPDSCEGPRIAEKSAPVTAISMQVHVLAD